MIEKLLNERGGSSSSSSNCVKRILVALAWKGRKEIREEMVENLPLLNKEDLYTLISHYHSLLPFLKTQHHLQLSDILSCFTTLPKSLSNHLADPYLSILQLHFHSRYSGSSTFNFTRILPFPSFEPYHISLLDLLITNYDIKVSVFTNLSLFHKVTQMTLLRYKDN